MRITAFAFNRQEKAFFEKIAPHLHATLKTVYVNKKYAISKDALFALSKNDLKEETEFKLAFEEARASRKKTLPEKIALKYYTLLTTHYLFMKYYTLLQREKPDILMLWSGVTFRQSIAKKAAKALNIQSLFIENGLLPQTIVIDPVGVNYDNSLPKNADFYKNYRPPQKPLPQKLIPRAPKNADKFTQKAVSLPNRYIFIPFQVDYDTQLIVNSPHIANMRELFDMIEQVQKRLGDPSLHFVFKEHPSSLIEYPDLHERAKEHTNLHIINGYPTQELIEKSLAVVTINSTVGIEALLLEKKVIVLGNAFYAIEGIVKQARTASQLVEILDTLQRWQPDAKLREKFLKYLYFEYLVPGTFEEDLPAQYAKINAILKKLT